jgi:hypothetical protein
MKKALEGIPETSFGSWLTPMPSAKDLLPKELPLPLPQEDDSETPNPIGKDESPNLRGLETPPDLDLDF